MAIVNVGTTSIDASTRYSYQHKIVKTSGGVLVLFADAADAHLRYKTSSDNGVTWDSSWTTVESSNYSVDGDFDVIIDGSDNIYTVFYGGGSGGIYLYKLTYSGGSWTVGTRRTIAGNYCYYVSLVKRASGELFVTFFYGYSGAWRLYGFYSTDDGASWNNNYYTLTDTLSGTRCFEVGSTIWCIVTTAGGKLQQFIWNDIAKSWNAPTDIASGITNSSYSLGACKISDSNIFAAVRTSSGIKIYNYTGSWDSGTLLSDNSNDQDPALSIVANNPVIIWTDYTGTQYNISYRKWNGSAWESQVDITSDIAVDKYPSVCISDSQYLYVEYTTGSSNPYTIYFDSIFLNPTKTVTILSDTKIKSVDNQKTILSDALITSIIQKTIQSDAKILALDIQETILSDAKLVDEYNKTILSDTSILAVIQKTILSDAKICVGVLYDIINKITFVKDVLSDINNKVNTVIQNLSDVNNFINTCKSVISDAVNDFRTQKLTLNNVVNDIRFLYSWQKSASGILQSLGKGYIKVYIAGAEQTDVDVNSISISKDLDSSHTATFDLGRAYDTTKPAMEATIEIKYNNWVLFSGYITSISPSEDPEKMRINCQDEYWKQNKSNVYYHIGHKPTDNKELYYETLAAALTTQHSWTPGPGNFCPETMDNFSVGKSEAITNLIKEMGNYGWFYDVDGTKKLWSAGEGSVIELKRQALGANINLYDVINHSFDESVEDIVNKFRVQMGNKIVQKDNRTHKYTGYNYASYVQFVTPAWDRSLELMSNNTSSGYGFDHRNPAGDYSDVFTKYDMPYLNPELSSWSDQYPPRVEIYNVGNAFGFIGPLNLSLETVLKEGFTIDYENGILKLSEPMFLYQTGANGECTAVRAPIVKVVLWKKNYYTYTLDPTDDPETDISNPLMFFTAKMGTYPDTIIKDLNLSNLSIQIGMVQHNYATGIDTIIPTWDDTAFAQDIADWTLSKSCDKKIKGTIEITLDALCFYGINLTNRIYIAGITDEAMNITGITYNMSSFTVSLTLENSRYYSRSISYQSHGE